MLAKCVNLLLNYSAFKYWTLLYIMYTQLEMQHITGWAICHTVLVRLSVCVVILIFYVAILVNIVAWGDVADNLNSQAATDYLQEWPHFPETIRNTTCCYNTSLVVPIKISTQAGIII